MEGRRVALLVATDRYQDTDLTRLAAPASDAKQLAAVLRNVRIAGFEVTRLYNRPHYVVGRAIGDFYRDRRRDDLTLLYFSGHGVKDEDGNLYLAMTDTDRENLQFTGVSCEQIRATMEVCRSQQKVLVLDCCYAGAFPAGFGPKGDPAIHALEQLGGRGCVVLTSSDAMQLSFEGGQVTEVGPASLRSGPSSLFTRYLIEGLRTGKADLDGDGDITLDELYSYVHNRVTDEQPLQRPKIKEDVEGRICFAQNIYWALPSRISDAVNSPYAPGKLSALDELRSLHSRGNATVKQRVLETVRVLASDDSKRVSSAGCQLLSELIPQEQRLQAEEQARREAEQKAQREAEEQAQREAQEQARREAEQKAQREAEEQAQREAQEQARREAEQKAQREAEEQAQREAQEQARREAEQKAQREAEEQAQREAQEQARREAEQKAQREAEEQAQREAQEQARREAEQKAQREAEEQAQREAQEQARREAEEQAQREAEEVARRQAAETAQREAEEAARREDETSPASSVLVSAPAQPEVADRAAKLPGAGNRGQSPSGGTARGRKKWPWAAGGFLAAVVVTVVAVLLATSSPSKPSTGGTSTTVGTPVTGGTAVWAEQPSSAPNYIFPFDSGTYASLSNTGQFQYLMYRPLYWFGNGTQPTLNNSLSLANPPTFNGNNVTITLKHYMWSNGTPVTAQNVMFWLNMEEAVGATDYGSYTGFPSTVVSNIKVVSPTELTMTMDKSYSPTWLLYNNLSQITPMPAAWDRTASGPSNCAITVRDCAAVYAYLNAQSKDLNSYVGSPLWSIVDGPWKLSAFNAGGHVTFVPNKSYSGPVKPKLSAFQEVPSASDAAEYGALQAASTSSKIDVGYIPLQDIPAKPANIAAGSNPLASHGYTLSPLYVWGINYYVVNFQSTVSDHAAVIRQRYFRQTLAYLMNQAAVISGPLKGYGTPTVGPVANTPVTPFLSSTGKAGDLFPYDPGKAKSLLTSHGWNVVPGGVTTCANPSLCGAGIAKGTALSFNFPYSTGESWLTAEMTQLRSNAAALGIKLNLQPEQFTQVVVLAGGNCVVAHLPCNWDIANWGSGWSFSPDYLPTGEAFLSGAIANSGGYSDSTNDAMINQTLTDSNLSSMYSWQDYLASQLPVMWQPNAAYQLTEVANNLMGVLPQSPTLALNPEDWYFVK